MRYSLERIGDVAGDSGPMSITLPVSDPIEHNCRPTVGKGIRVGSYTGRTFQAQDWWQTSAVLEITKDTPNEVHFRTRNSNYIWKQF